MYMYSHIHRHVIKANERCVFSHSDSFVTPGGSKHTTACNVHIHTIGTYINRKHQEVGMRRSLLYASRCFCVMSKGALSTGRTCRNFVNGFNNNYVGMHVPTNQTRLLAFLRDNRGVGKVLKYAQIVTLCAGYIIEYNTYICSGGAERR